MSEKSTTDQILDLLLDALQERQAARNTDTDEKANIAQELPKDVFKAVDQLTAPIVADEQDTNFVDPEPLPLAKEVEKTAVRTTLPTEPAPVAQEPQMRPTIHLEQLLGRMVLGIAVLIVLINIPFNMHGTALARAMPDEAALVIRDGLLLKGTSDKVYVLENNELRWVTSLDVFQYEGYRWENVHDVDDTFIAQFDQGYPVYIAYKCATSPHVYVFEDGAKRWVKDVPTFTELGLIWEEVRIMPCSTLRNMSDGLPIPPDAGEPPQP